MPRRRKPPEPEDLPLGPDGLPDLCGRQRGRFPAQWSELHPEQLEAAHKRARALRERGHGAVIWGESTSGEIFGPG